MLEVTLLEPTPEAWVKKAVENFSDFLADHAACERKASATGLQFVCKYPERTELIDPMIRLAREELLHFHQVSKLMAARGVQMRSDEPDPYVNALLKHARNGKREHFLDRLLIFGLIERRGTERFRMISQHLPDEELSTFYRKLSEAEERHHVLFTELALLFFSKEEVSKRLRQLEIAESEIMLSIPIRAAVH